MKNFGLIGVGGYIAPRHLKAIKETDNNLSVSMGCKRFRLESSISFFLTRNSFSMVIVFADYVTRLKKN